MTDETYSYRENGRTPAKLLMCAVGLAFAVGLLVKDEPVLWYFWAIVGVPNAMLIWMVAANPHYGMDLDATALTLLEPNGDRVLALPDIASVHIANGSDGTNVTVLMQDGTLERVFDWSHPSAHVLAAELQRRSIAVDMK